MELEALNGNIIGIVNYKIKEQFAGLVKDIVVKKPEKALQMVGLDTSYLDKDFDTLSYKDKNKVILASKLQDRVIVLNDFSRGLTKKDMEFFKSLFKKVVNYGRRIVLLDKKGELFLNLVDYIYVVNGKEILTFKSVFAPDLAPWIQEAKIVEFTHESLHTGIKINEYKELDDLLKAIYRIKS